MKSATAMFRIRNFGNDTDCFDLADLIEKIAAYKDKSVTIDDLREGGRHYHVDVLPSGLVYESYGSRCRFDIDLRLDRPGGN